jgi:tRNA C32,U32 (ribose-2'-O)-methylase TrmJ
MKGIEQQLKDFIGDSLEMVKTQFERECSGLTDEQIRSKAEIHIISLNNAMNIKQAVKSFIVPAFPSNSQSDLKQFEDFMSKNQEYPQLKLMMQNVEDMLEYFKSILLDPNKARQQN